jgi:hypothetical protein
MRYWYLAAGSGCSAVAGGRFIERKCRAGFSSIVSIQISPGPLV